MKIMEKELSEEQLMELMPRKMVNKILGRTVYINEYRDIIRMYNYIHIYNKDAQKYLELFKNEKGILMYTMRSAMGSLSFKAYDCEKDLAMYKSLMVRITGQIGINSLISRAQWGGKENIETLTNLILMAIKNN